jgi:hypothetical protein
MNSAPRSVSFPGRLAAAVMARARRAWNAVYPPWRRFWFEPTDPTPLGVMRILFGGLLLYTHIVWGLNLEGFFGPEGWQGETLVRALQDGQSAWSFWWWIPVSLHVAVHIACLLVLLLFWLGAFTPVTSVLAYLITVSYATRAPLANYGLDQINGLAALYLAIGPSGSTLSIDRLRQRFRAAREQIALGLEPVVPPVKPSARANLALRLIQVHLCVIYTFACLSKLQGDSWWNGTAIWQAVSNLEYQSRDLTWLAWYPWLVNLLTHATIAWEMTFWALVWRPILRPFVLLGGVAIHVGIGAFMGMWTFGLAMIFAYVAFVPGAQVSAVLRQARRLALWTLRSLRLEPGPAASQRARALWFALGWSDQPAEAAATLAVATPSEAPTTDSADLPTIPPAIDVPPLSAPIPANADRRATVPPTRPAVLLVEGRLKRQAEVQEYFLSHGFRCHVASELHQARSMLAVIDFDVLVVTSSWFSEDELAAFHDGLAAGGEAMPASVFLLNPLYRQTGRAFHESPRHRVLVGSLSLRELRLLVLNVLGISEEALRPFMTRQAHSKNGRRRTVAPELIPENGQTHDAAPESPPLDVPSASAGNGSPS